MKSNVVIIQIANGRVKVINSPDDIKHVVINWDAEDYESMLLEAGMSEDKAIFYSNWIAEEEFDFSDQAGFVIKEFLDKKENDKEFVHDPQ